VQPHRTTRQRKNIAVIGLSILSVILFIALGYTLTLYNETIVKLANSKAELLKLNDQMSLTAASGNLSFTKGVNNVYSVGYCVEPNHALVRDMATLVVKDTPIYVENNDEMWKIWQINNWVHFSISYVSDPANSEYFAAASETLVTRAGDCDDIATLTASMLEAVGLDASLAFVDTSNDGKVDHLACIVYYPGTEQEYLDKERELMDSLNIYSSTGELQVMCLGIKDDVLDADLRQKYTDGVWVVIDPAVDIPGYIPDDSYKVILTIEVGSESVY
jgi:hypothetical protein